MLPIPDRSSAIAGLCVKFEFAHLVFLSKEARTDIQNFEWHLSRKGNQSADAMTAYHGALGQCRDALWQQCLDGHLTVRAKRRGQAILDAIPAAQLRTLWPMGPLFPHEDYEWIEVCGSVPSWVQISDLDFNPVMPEFRHSDDYRLVSIRSFNFEFGPAQAGIVRCLHNAARRIEQTLTEAEIRREAPFNGSLPDLFKRHQHWPELIQKVAKATYRLNLHSEPSWMDWANTDAEWR